MEHVIKATEWEKLETGEILTSLEIGIGVLAERDNVDSTWVLGLAKKLFDKGYPEKYRRNRTVGK